MTNRKRDAWLAAGGLERKERERVLPALLKNHCHQKYGTQDCVHFCSNRGRKGSKCMWFGWALTDPWRRPDECIADAKAGLIEDVQVTP